MNNAIRKKNQLLRYRQKFEFSLFADQILASTKNNLNYWSICMPGPTPHMLKRWNWALQPELDDTQGAKL